MAQLLITIETGRRQYEAKWSLGDGVLKVDLVLRPGKHNEETQRRATFKGEWAADLLRQAEQNPEFFLRYLEQGGHIDPDHDDELTIDADLF